MRIYPYTEKETDYLSARDERLAKVIAATGHIEREIDDGLFSSIVHQIIAQQISNKAQEAVWSRVKSTLGDVTAEKVAMTSEEALVACGTSRMKAMYIKGVSSKVLSGECRLSAIESMNDEDALLSLTAMRGVGEWTAQMVLLFGLIRQNVLSKKDAGIRRAIKIIYGHEADDSLFDALRLRLSPYCSVASLYFWHVAGGGKAQ